MYRGTGLVNISRAVAPCGLGRGRKTARRGPEWTTLIRLVHKSSGVCILLSDGSALPRL